MAASYLQQQCGLLVRVGQLELGSLCLLIVQQIRDNTEVISLYRAFDRFVTIEMLTSEKKLFDVQVKKVARKDLA